MLISIAWRNLWRNRTRSFAIICSVVLGIWAGAFIVSLYYGMGNERVRIAIRQEVSHLQIHPPKFREDYEARYNFSVDSITKVLQSVQNIKAFSIRSIAQGMLANATGSRGVQVNGVDSSAEAHTRDFASLVIQGRYLSAGRFNQVLVGKKLADKLKLNVGAKVVLTFQDQNQDITSGAFRVCGIYESANAPLDERNVYVDRNALNTLLGTSGRAMEAAVLLENEATMGGVQATLQQSLPGLQVEDWKAISPETALVMSSLDVSSLIIITIILLALAFGIINTMLMAMIERTREIGMLMAIGMNKFRLFRMVVFETMLLTLVGCPIGFGLAWMLNNVLSRSGINTASFAGNVMKQYGYGAIIYPDLPAFKVVQILEIVLITAFLASIFPAVKALRLRPAEAIRS